MVSGYYFPKLNSSAYPQEVVIELTNHCNLACKMCPHRTMTRPKGFMNEPLFRKIIDEINGKSELVYLYGTGESLLHKKLSDFISYAKSKGLETCLSTNGIPMNAEVSEQLLTSGLDYLIVALDGGTKETYEKIRVKGNFDVLIANIKTLLRYKASLDSKTKICLQMIYMEENAREIELFKNLFTPEEKLQVTQYRFKPLYETYALVKKRVYHTRPCYWLWNMMSIYWNGDVALCCMDSDLTYNLGNVAIQTIQDIWYSEQFMELRNMQKRLDFEKMPLCATCDIPEQGYFNTCTILGSVLLDASQVRDIIPLYEKYILLPFKSHLKKGV
ncbi:MAG TPA: radical SAM protein [Desulfatiglandales bacterium]|nr:radical SAM protein [Desulfatiglandales bacterium]